VFKPYAKGQGPTFHLYLYDVGLRRPDGKDAIGYKLTQSHKRRVSTLFEGSDIGCSPLHAIDSDETVNSVMSFLTLRPGDTDSEYFDGYTAAQKDCCEQHAEALSTAVSVWFGE
jgi:hypothetical protein